jgi:hypothetical protein
MMLHATWIELKLFEFRLKWIELKCIRWNSNPLELESNSKTLYWLQIQLKRNEIQIDTESIKKFACHFYHLFIVLKKSLALKRHKFDKTTYHSIHTKFHFKPESILIGENNIRPSHPPLNQFPCNHCCWNKTTWLCSCQNPPIINYTYPLSNKDILMVSTRRIYFCKGYFSDKIK